MTALNVVLVYLLCFSQGDGLFTNKVNTSEHVNLEFQQTNGTRLTLTTNKKVAISGGAGAVQTVEQQNATAKIFEHGIQRQLKKPF